MFIRKGAVNEALTYTACKEDLNDTIPGEAWKVYIVYDK